MPIKYGKKISHMDGHVAIEDAEVLFNWLQNNPKCKLNLRKCEHLHTSVLQLLMVMRPEISAWPENQSLTLLLRNSIP